MEKFLLGEMIVNTNIMKSPYDDVDYSRWFKWRGTGDPILTRTITTTKTQPYNPLSTNLFKNAHLISVLITVAYERIKICDCIHYTTSISEWQCLLRRDMDALNEICVTIGILVFDFEMYINELRQNQRNWFRQNNAIFGHSFDNTY